MPSVKIKTKRNLHKARIPCNSKKIVNLCFKVFFFGSKYKLISYARVSAYFSYYLGQKLITASGGLTLKNGRFSAVRPSMEAKAYSEARSSLFRFFFFSFYVSYFFSFSNKGKQTCQVHHAVSLLFPHFFQAICFNNSLQKTTFDPKIVIVEKNL